MKPPIGFVLVTYNNAEQTLFLCERPNAMFDKPPIVVTIHIDGKEVAQAAAANALDVPLIAKVVPQEVEIKLPIGG